MGIEIMHKNSSKEFVPIENGNFFKPALVLNADYRPLSYLPLSIWSWQDAVKAVYQGKVNIIANYDEIVRSPNFEMHLPSVICLKDYIKQTRDVAFTRFNLFLRDGFTCVYCGSKNDLTFDHVVPRAMGGKTTWENIVTACSSCNMKKGGKPLNKTNLHLGFKPYRPNLHELQAMGRKFPPHYLHQSWMDWLYWDVELLP